MQAFALAYKEARAVEVKWHAAVVTRDLAGLQGLVAIERQLVVNYMWVEGRIGVVGFTPSGEGLLAPDYSKLPRTPVTRVLVDAAVANVELTKAADSLELEFHSAIAAGRSDDVLALAPRVDAANEQARKAWLDLSDRIDDALRVWGLSWAVMGGPPP